jgi:hypothetical protein
MLADVIGYHHHRDSIHAALRDELTRASTTAAARHSDRSSRWRSAWAASRSWTCSPPGRRRRWTCVTIGSQAPLLYTFDAVPALPYDEVDPPRLPVPWLNIYDSRDFLSFIAEVRCSAAGTAWRASWTCASARQGLPGVLRVLGCPRCGTRSRPRSAGDERRR